MVVCLFWVTGYNVLTKGASVWIGFDRLSFKIPRFKSENAVNSPSIVQSFNEKERCFGLRMAGWIHAETPLVLNILKGLNG